MTPRPSANDRPASGAAASPRALARELGVFGATMMGLGSIVGTGIFVSIAIAVGVAGPSVVLAIAIAALLAVCNALSSAQLAANHPAAGGTYEYGYVYLTPSFGFAAGWMFLCAKSASAATAALGFAGYALAALGAADSGWRTPLALAAVAALTLIVLGGIRRSSVANITIVSITLLSLLFFIFAGLPGALRNGAQTLSPFFESPAADGRPAAVRLLEASALMFVAYTGYGRIATLGEEVREPRRTIPRAIVLTLLASMTLYIAVALTGVAAAGAETFAPVEAGGAGGETGAPLAIVARTFNIPGAALILTVGAVTAMLGVLLNLILGLSRVALAMGRRRDLPAGRLLGRLNPSGTTPTAAVVLVAALIAALTALGSIRLAWSFSAFTVLVYYAITNLAALRLPRDARLYHPIFPAAGLAGCLALAFWVDPRAWLAGLAILAIGLLARGALRARRGSA